MKAQTEIHLKVLRLLQSNPELNQREMADLLGVSLGKMNYCLKALVDRGYVKMQNFLGSRNKLAYSYLLTPSGMIEKASLTRSFLNRKAAEYKALKNEIDSLKSEIDQDRKGLI
jgi:EPS-associated MarR family transcriptional regulator